MSDTSVLFKSAESHAAFMALYDKLLASIPVPLDCFPVTTRLAETHIMAAGPQDAPPMVLLMGLGGSGPHWKDQYRAFAQVRRVYAPDLPGMPGRSAPARPRGSDYVRWLLDVFDALHVQKADLLGLSLGGHIAMRFAAEHPDRINKLVLLSPVSMTRMRFSIILETSSAGLGLRPNAGEARDAVARDLVAADKNPIDADMAEMLRLFTTEYRMDTVGMLPIALGLRDSTLRRITAPTLLLMGEYEKLFDVQKVIRRAKALLPNFVAGEVVPGAGHGLNGDQPALVNARVVKFLVEGV